MHVYVNGEFIRNPNRYRVDEFGGGGNLVIPQATTLGKMAEIIIYNRMLNDNERSGIEAYLAGKYSIKTIPRWKRTTPTGEPTQINQKSITREPLRVYPNPSDGMNLYIEIPGNPAEEVIIKVYHLNGSELLSKKKQTTAHQAYHLGFGKELTPGIYFIKVIGGNRIYTEKFIVN